MLMARRLGSNGLIEVKSVRVRLTTLKNNKFNLKFNLEKSSPAA